MGQTFEELIGLHLDDLYSAALCFTLDEHRAEELLQEASIRAFHELSRGPRGTDFRTGMLGVLVTTHLLRQSRQGVDPFSSEPEPLDEMLRAAPVNFEPFPEPGTAGYRLMRDWMSRVWSDLDAGDRIVLWLTDVERIRHPVVAGITGLDVDEVRSRHYRARLAMSRGAAEELDRAVGGAEV
jgi:DNA-directed RNA polymerase specialized sigma24 family protein